MGGDSLAMRRLAVRSRVLGAVLQVDQLTTLVLHFDRCFVGDGERLYGVVGV